MSVLVSLKTKCFFLELRSQLNRCAIRYASFSCFHFTVSHSIFFTHRENMRTGIPRAVTRFHFDMSHDGLWL